jgi:hypothetical protein
MRRLIALLVTLVLLALVADRVAWWVAEKQIAKEIQGNQNLSTTPDVSVGGFPFLTQAFAGRYQKIDVDLVKPEVDNGLTIDTLDVQLRGVHVSTGDLINGQVSAVPVDSATAVASVSYAALNAAVAANLPDGGSTLKFAPGDDGWLVVTGTYRASGLSIRLESRARLLAKNGDLVIQLDPASLDGVPALVRPEVRRLVAQASELPSLPFGFQAESVQIGAEAITVAATSVTLDLLR